MLASTFYPWPRRKTFSSVEFGGAERNAPLQLAEQRDRVKRKRHCRHATMLRDNPVGLIRADEAARKEVTLSRCFLSSHPTVQSRNIGRKDPTCLKMPGRLSGREAATTAPKKVYRPAGIGYLRGLHMPVSYPTCKSLDAVHQTSSGAEPEKDGCEISSEYPRQRKRGVTVFRRTRSGKRTSG